MTGKARGDELQCDGNRITARIPEFRVVRNDAKHTYIGIGRPLRPPGLSFVAPQFFGLRDIAQDFRMTGNAQISVRTGVPNLISLS
jgi:hypothetical protein